MYVFDSIKSFVGASLTVVPPLKGDILTKAQNLGALPLIFLLPFMHSPKLLEGDTQPWVFLAGLFALMTFKQQRFLNYRDIPLLVLSVLCVLSYAFRTSVDGELLRTVYMHIAFVVFWMVVRRESTDLFPIAVRFTVVVWLAVGLYQYVAVIQGLPVEFTGRFLEGRGGIPSLTAEPSFYGSMSMLHLMYLLNDQSGRHKLFFCLAAGASVVLSGSLLALLLFVFPLLKLRLYWRVLALAAGILVLFFDSSVNPAGLTMRMAAVLQSGLGVSAILSDPSLNLRFGHMYFTLVHNLFPSLLLTSPVNFMADYNQFAAASGIYIDTGSNFILPALGELVYSGGPFGLALAIGIILFAVNASPKRWVEKTAFMLACLVNPLQISNPFLLIYALQRDTTDSKS